MQEAVFPNCPVQWLEQEFIRRKEERKQYSLRQFARKLGLPPGRLSELLSRKRKITPLVAQKLADRLELAPKQREAFLQSVYQGALHQETFPKRDEVLLEEEVFHLISDWYHFAILSLINTDNFDPDPKAIAKRLGISVVEVRNALQRLTTLNLIEKKGRTLVRTKDPLTTTWDIPSAALKKSHRQELERAREALDTVSVEKRDVSAFTMAVNVQRLPQAKKLIREFQKRMEAVLEVGKRTEVYSLNVQLLPVTIGEN